MLLRYFKQALLLGEEVRNCRKDKTQNLRKSHMKKSYRDYSFSVLSLFE